MMPRSSSTFACAMMLLYANRLRKRPLSTALTFSCLVKAGARAVLLFLFFFFFERFAAVCAFLFVHSALQVALRIPPAEITALVAEMLLTVFLNLRQLGAAEFAVQIRLHLLFFSPTVAFDGSERQSRLRRRRRNRQSFFTTRVNLFLLIFCHFQSLPSLFSGRKRQNFPPLMQKRSKKTDTS